MRVLVDKALLFTLCCVTVILLPQLAPAAALVGALCGVGASALASWLDSTRVRAGLYVGFLLLCLAFPASLPFLPLLVYDCAALRHWWARLCWLPAWLLCLHSMPPLFCAVCGLLAACSLLLRLHAQSAEQARSQARATLDDVREQNLRLERKNHDLLEKQAYEVHIATLDERTRIAREIHDNVGHLLTRALLQVGAMQVSCREQPVAPQLEQIKDTLDEAMHNIRRSVHDLRDEAVDLPAQLYKSCHSFVFCPVQLCCELLTPNPPPALSYTILAIVKEALSNIARHSNATKAQVRLLEHPAFYQLTVQDNGSRKFAPHAGSGMGLQNMQERVEAHKGVFRIFWRNGCRIFITLPKPKPQGGAGQ